MIPGATRTPASVSSLYERWYRHFLEKRDSPCALPWHDSYLLCSAERRLVARSIQQFQLGEWARGRGLVRRASSHPVLSTDLWFLPSLDLFIAEEQRHSAILGRFLDRERILRLSNHWLDSMFRDPGSRSEEHTSELQSRLHLVCRLLLEKKKYKAMLPYCPAAR